MLDKLVGQEFDFYGVDNNSFKLGDTVFEALEDEDDGYRSSLGSIEVKDPEGLIFFQTVIARVRVENAPNIDGHQLVDIDDGHVWLEIGTSDYDDYYPCFVFSYHPKAVTV